ncbi:MAG TPA: urease accessory UreF family protein [Humisphaera sp.]
MPDASSFSLQPSSSDSWRLWQLIDSAFPTGGFAHSGGVEAAWQHGLIRDGDDLAGIVSAGIRQAARSAGPVVLAVLADPGDFARRDRAFDATVTNHVANRASRAQGRAVLNAAADAFDLPEARSAAGAVRRGESPGHLPAAFGLACAGLRVPPPAAAQAYLFAVARGLISAAVRLGAVGPMEGQRLQALAAQDANAHAGVCLTTSADDIAQSAPFLDLLQASQDRLYSRLFQS